MLKKLMDKVRPGHVVYGLVVGVEGMVKLQIVTVYSGVVVKIHPDELESVPEQFRECFFFPGQYAIYSVDPEMVDSSADLYKDVAEFHRKFHLAPSMDRHRLPPDIQNLKIRHLLEEIFEYGAAVGDSKIKAGASETTRLFKPEDALDALVDLVYVALGTAYLHGFQFNAAWNRVHAANMRKTRAKNASESKRGSSFDVIKPEGWTPPDLSDLVEGEQE